MKILKFLIYILIISCNAPKREPVTIFCNHPGPSSKIEAISLKDKKKIKELNGKFVQVEGVFNYYFENIALFPSKKFEPKNAVWLNLLIPDSISINTIDSLNSRKILVIGRVNTKYKGHMNEYFAELDSVICLKVL